MTPVRFTPASTPGSTSPKNLHSPLDNDRSLTPHTGPTMPKPSDLGSQSTPTHPNRHPACHHQLRNSGQAGAVEGGG